MMIRLRFFLLVFLAWGAAVAAEAPLRVFIRSGPKSHGPGAHDYPRFLREWVPLLNERGARATGGNTFPTEAQLAETDVLILHAQEAGNIPAVEDRAHLDAFLRRGGGLVVIHAGAVSADPDWFKSIVGGSWRNGVTRWLEGPMQLYFTDRDHAITRDCSNWAMDDEIYYDMDLLPAAHVLATAYTPKAAGARNEAFLKRANELTAGGKTVSIYDIQPQMWTYERTLAGAAVPYRAFVSIPGHYYENFNRPNYRAILLRGLAWAGRRANVDELCRPDELGDHLRYVEGGPVRPSEAAAKIEVHPDFKMNLVASEPLINKVMNLDWDERGRLWVCETPEYPNGRRQPKGAPWKDSGSVVPYVEDRVPLDRISVLTDTDGDGVMDHKQVFADGLELVTSFVLYGRGVIAAAAPDIWFLEDTDGDGRADRRTKLYTGLGIADTHAVINNLRWGLDGWIYASHGYSRGEVTSPDGQRAFGVGGSGVVRFKPDGSAFEQFSSRGGNTWGVETTWDGQVFWTQPTSGTVFFHTLLPESVLARARVPGTTSWKGMITNQRTYPAMSWTEQAYVQIDQVGRFTAAAGCAIYESGGWPAQWNYSYFTAEPTLNIVHHEFVRPDGVSYTTVKEKGREETEFMRSTDLWFRPIDTRIGPDGALYVIDFYNQAVIHNDTRGPQHGPANAAVRPDRDHYFARIWRVQHKAAPTVAPLNLDRRDLPGLLSVIRTHPQPTVKKIAWRLVRENHGAAGESALAALHHPLGSVPYRRFLAAEKATTPQQRRAVIDEYVQAADDWTRSALLAAASDQAAAYVAESFQHPRAPELAGWVGALVPAMAVRETDLVLVAAGEAPPRAAPLVMALLKGLAASDAVRPEPNAAALAGLRRLIQNSDTAAAALPLAVNLDRGGQLAAEVTTAARRLGAELANPATSDSRRAGLAESLLSVPAGRAEALAAAESLLENPSTSDALKAALTTAVGANSDPAAAAMLVKTYVTTRSASIFEQLLKRADSTRVLIAAIRAGHLKIADLGPVNLARLRTHPDRAVAAEASELLASLNPQTREKGELIARWAPEVEKPGDATRGRTLFTAACAVCHRLGDLGQRDVGPPLSGMGAHGPAELLVHILDPNREVDPSFVQWNLTLKNGDSRVGVIVTENAASLTLRNQGGDTEVRKEDIATRENTGRSLMPEGFEALGVEGLRDLLAFVCGSDRAFRALDLRDLYTADNRRGMFRRADLPEENVALHRFGNVNVAGVPFFVMDPAKSSTGRSVIVLKGGPGTDNVSDGYPQRVVVPVNATAASLHVLGGVAGWGWPLGGEAARGRPAMKVIIEFADGVREERVLGNGEVFVDYKSTAEASESQNAGDFTQRGQLRYFALNFSRRAEVKQVVLESFDNDIAPCTVALTLGTEPAAKAVGSGAVRAAPPTTSGPKRGAPTDAPLPPTQPISWQPGQKHVLIIAGGSSHNFGKFFGETDGATLRAAGFDVHYTEDRDQAAEELARADVAVISVNRKFFDTPEYRGALQRFAAAGKGLVMLHPGTWYGFAEWPELNAEIVGGGARGHDKWGAFSVQVLRADHPVMAGVPARFAVEDELYYFNAEPEKIPAGTAAIDVLAETSPSVKYQRPHPAVWITRHATARVVGITLGHDQRVHDLPAFQRLLVNAVTWAGGK